MERMKLNANPGRVVKPPPLGVVAFSFAYRGPDGEPNPCNVRLAKAVERTLDAVTADVVLVAQWEVSRVLRRTSISVDHTVEQPADGSYLSSEQVWAEARDLFRAKGVQTVVPVAAPFLQMFKVKNLIRAAGFRVETHRIGHVGFDRSRLNLQWWTRGPVRLVLYALLQAATRHRRTVDSLGANGSPRCWGALRSDIPPRKPGSPDQP